MRSADASHLDDLVCCGVSVKALRVALVSDGLYPYFKGGKEVRLHELTPRLVGLGVAVDYYTMRWWGRGRVRTDQGVRFVAVGPAVPMYSGTRRSIVQAVVFALGCLRLAVGTFDLIDADHMPYLQLVPLRLVAWIRRRPMIITWHEWWGAEYWNEYLGGAGRVAAVIERSCLRLADHFITETDETASRLAAAGVDPARITVIAPGIDLDVVRSIRPGPEPVDVLYSGRLLQHKGVDLLLQALAQLGAQGQTLSAVIIGEGPEEESLPRLARELGIDGRVSFRKPVAEREELFALMKSAGVFVLPSVREGYGMAVAEAIACGVPVVTTDHPDNHAQHLVAPYPKGFLSPPTATGLAAAIGQALRGPTTPPDGLDESLDWSAKASELADTYRRVVAG